MNTGYETAPTVVLLENMMRAQHRLEYGIWNMSTGYETPPTVVLAG